MPCNVPQVLSCSIDIALGFSEALWKSQYKAASAKGKGMCHIRDACTGDTSRPGIRGEERKCGYSRIPNRDWSLDDWLFDMTNMP